MPQREDLQAARAWDPKESCRTFWDNAYPRAPRTCFARSYWRSTPSRPIPAPAAAKLICRHLPHPPTCVCQGMTTAGLEAAHAVIRVKKIARGFRNPEHVRIAIYTRRLRRQVFRES